MLSSCSYLKSSLIKFSFSTVAESFKILGVPKSSSHSQIKKKYYQLAKLYHPDVNKELNAHQKFSQITKAYQILIQRNGNNHQQSQQSSPYKKNRHNPYQHQSHKRTKAHFQQDWQDFQTYDTYYKSKQKFRRAKRGQDIYVNLSISLTESCKGAKKSVNFSRKQNCEACFDIEAETCIACGGKGEVFHRKNKEKIQCENCQGFGYKLKCQECHGTRYVMKDVQQEIYVQKGTHDRSILRVKNNGHRGYKHSNGDLYVTIHVQQSQKMKIDGNNIHSQLQLQYITAVFGGQIQIQTVQGKKTINVPAGTQSGQQMRLFNYGIKSPYSKQVGDHIIKFKIKVPKKLSTYQKKLMSQLCLQEFA